MSLFIYFLVMVGYPLFLIIIGIYVSASLLRRYPEKYNEKQKKSIKTSGIVVSLYGVYELCKFLF